VGLEQDPLSLVSITEELLEWKSSGSALTTLALSSSKGGGHSVGRDRLQTKSHGVFTFFVRFSERAVSINRV
jgi:hypothetical protein